ncbi:hypothetical protein CPLU01_09885 [Colletotrichum plurivorum]|uniref:Uncharacterized protein n=1 Tax=Colletotrichum plurivorum TaxID=2175906 RepID=A0A8H6NA57_9PEZI|nr:hypothetical protein CPLU01_09885 [Colletotrichum plurivorum]
MAKDQGQVSDELGWRALLRVCTAAAWTRHGDKRSEGESRRCWKRRHRETFDGTKSHVVDLIGEGTWHPGRHGRVQQKGAKRDCGGRMVGVHGLTSHTHPTRYTHPGTGRSPWSTVFRDFQFGVDVWVTEGLSAAVAQANRVFRKDPTFPEIDGRRPTDRPAAARCTWPHSPDEDGLAKHSNPTWTSRACPHHRGCRASLYFSFIHLVPTLHVEASNPEIDAGGRAHLRPRPTTHDTTLPSTRRTASLTVSATYDPRVAPRLFRHSFQNSLRMVS